MRNRSSRGVRLLLVGLLPGLLAGCWLRGPGDVRREVVRMSDLRLDREFGLQVGRPTLFLVRQGLRIAGEQDTVPLKGVRRVELGVYRVEGPRGQADGIEPASLRRGGGRGPSLCAASFADWEPVVRVCDGDEHVLLFTRFDEHEAIRGVLIVVQDPAEVVIVRARGRLDRLMERVLELADDEGLFGRVGDGRRDSEYETLQAAGLEVAVRVCEPEAGDDAPEDPAEPGTCTDRDEARGRVMEIARALTLDETRFH